MRRVLRLRTNRHSQAAARDADPGQFVIESLTGGEDVRDQSRDHKNVHILRNILSILISSIDLVEVNVSMQFSIWPYGPLRAGLVGP